MKNLDNKLKCFILAILLLIVSLIFIALNANTYTVTLDDISGISSLEDINIKIEDKNIIKYVDKDIENGVLKIKFESVSRGKSYVEISYDNNDITMFYLYVHSFGIITFNEYMGDSNGSIIIPISIVIFSTYVLYLLIISYKNSKNKNLYQYKNISFLGLIIFIIFTIISQLFAISNYKGFISTINSLLNMFSFTKFLLPIAFIVSILVIISNILLIKKEGFGFRNVLGILLGVTLCFASILPDMLYRMLFSVTWIDIHNERGLGLYIYNLIESIIYITITYIECILLGTIIMSVKAAKYVPKFDKDCIIILGCKIKLKVL